MSTLYVTDLDGTLLTPDMKCSAYTLEALNRMIQSGALITVATARSWASAVLVMKGLALRLPVVLNNGAIIFDPMSGKLIQSHILPRDIIRQFSDHISVYETPHLVYSFIDGRERVSWLEGSQNEGVTGYIKSRAKNHDPRLRPVDTLEALYEGDIFYITAIGDKHDLLPKQQWVHSLSGIAYNFLGDTYNPDEYWLEIYSELATKANGARWLKRFTGADRVVCFGDHLNDLPMFEVTDECYAVADASQIVKDAATGIIGSNREDGVARWLEREIERE